MIADFGTERLNETSKVQELECKLKTVSSLVILRGWKGRILANTDRTHPRKEIIATK